MHLANKTVLFQHSHIEWLKPYFRTDDYAVTLTFRENINQYKSGYQANYTVYNKHIHHYLNVLNRKFLGNSKAKLSCAYVWEFNAYYGIHAHMILMAPPETKIPKDMHETVIRQAWERMKCSGYVGAMDVKLVDDVAGWLAYIFKDVRPMQHASTSFDVDDWILPIS